MSNITTIYDRVLVVLAEAFTDSTRIPNPYSLEDNNDNFLRKGWGMKIGESNPEEYEFCSYVNNREISIVFTVESFRLGSETTRIDDLIKDLLERVKTTQDLFYSYSELGIEENILKVDIGGVSSIVSTPSDKSKFLSIECSFNFFIKEDL